MTRKKLIGTIATGALFLLVATPVTAKSLQDSKESKFSAYRVSQDTAENENEDRQSQSGKPIPPGFWNNPHVQQILNRYAFVRDQIPGNLFQTEKDLVVQHYQDQLNAFKQLADAFDQKGFNTTQFRNDLNQMEAKMNQLSQDYNALVNQWNTVISNQNSTNPQDINTLVSQIQSQLDKVRSDLVDLRQFVNTTIHQDILNLVQSGPYAGQVTPTPMVTPTPTP